MGYVPALQRILYPNWVNLTFFTSGWWLFFREEVYHLTILLALVFLWLYFVVGFALIVVATHVFLAVLFRRLMAGGLCTSTKRLTGQTVIITGANVGIGKETARDMLRREAHVIMACRDLKKAEAAKQDLQKEGGTIEVRILDLSSLQSVRDFADGIIRDNIKVHILINNAGIMKCPCMKTQDGFEIQMGTNHLGHFLLTNLLLPQMKHGEPARIINVSSLAHIMANSNFDNFDYMNGNDIEDIYAKSKLANILFTRHLANVIVKGTNIQMFSLHPGVVNTTLNRHQPFLIILNFIFRLLMKTTKEGAMTTIYCATEAKQHEEMYFSDCAVGWPSTDATDDLLAEKLWKQSAELVGLTN